MDVYSNCFLELSDENLYTINAGIHVLLIVGGVITLIGGIASCFIPGGQPLGLVACFAGVVGIIAGIIW